MQSHVVVEYFEIGDIIEITDSLGEVSRCIISMINSSSVDEEYKIALILSEEDEIPGWLYAIIPTEDFNIVTPEEIKSELGLEYDIKFIRNKRKQQYNFYAGLVSG